jgi:bile-acid 7alpha-dehydratase
MVDLQEVEAIKRLKYKYLRCLDQKLWAELAQCFTEDATSAYSDGKYSFSGRDKIMEFLRGALGPRTMISSHRVHHPEIDLTTPTTATGIWALEDTVIETNTNITIRGAAFYHDEYVKSGGQWKIKSTGYTRTFEEVVSRRDTPSLQLTANCWASD